MYKPDREIQTKPDVEIILHLREKLYYSQARPAGFSTIFFRFFL